MGKKVNKNFIDRLKHRLRAKGRHGTHSPFVYSFVESVLRNKKNTNSLLKTFSPTLQDIIKTVQFLRPSNIYASENFYTDLEKVIRNNNSFYRFEKMLYPISLNSSDKKHEIKFPENSLFVFNAIDIPHDMIPCIFSSENVALYVSQPYYNHQTIDWWKHIVKNPSIKFSIDCFGFGLLINRKAFHEKQHFVLK